jgi:outer membrane protein TolC
LQENATVGARSRDRVLEAAPSPSQPAPSAVRISVKDGETLALQHNPQITHAKLLAMAAHQATRVARSNLWPSAVLDLTGVDSADGSGISAGGLNNPIIMNAPLLEQP